MVTTRQMRQKRSSRRSSQSKRISQTTRGRLRRNKKPDYVGFKVIGGGQSPSPPVKRQRLRSPSTSPPSSTSSRGKRANKRVKHNAIQTHIEHRHFPLVKRQFPNGGYYFAVGSPTNHTLTFANIPSRQQINLALDRLGKAHDARVNHRSQSPSRRSPPKAYYIKNTRGRVWERRTPPAARTLGNAYGVIPKLAEHYDPEVWRLAKNTSSPRPASPARRSTPQHVRNRSQWLNRMEQQMRNRKAEIAQSRNKGAEYRFFTVNTARR